MSGVAPAGNFEASERPDFLFTSGDRTTGVEVVEIFQDPEGGRPLQALEGDADWVVQRAREIAENQATPPALVSVSFAGSRIPHRQQRQDAARALAEVVRQNMPPMHRPLTLRNRWPRYEAPNFLHSVTIVRLKDESAHVWDCGGAGFVNENCSSQLQATMDAKALLFDEYLLRCDECWLLIATDGRNASAFLEPDRTTAEKTYRSPFHRTFFLNLMASQWLELATTTCPLQHDEQA